MQGSIKQLIAGAVTLVALLAWPAASQAAYQTNGVAVTPFATGFATDAAGTGPIGLAFDHSNRLYVDDKADSTLYRFDGPGAAGPSHALGGPIAGDPRGLAFDNSGRLFLVLKTSGQVVQLNPDTGAIIGVVASGLGCPLGLAADPSSGDLYVTEPCGARVVRIAGPASGAPAVSTFATGFADIDGIAVSPDGTVYVVDTGKIIQIAGPSSATPGAQTVLTTVSGADGLAPGQITSGKPRFLIVNRNDGAITRVDLGSSPPKLTDLVTGGTRGDFATVGFDGCLYATQTDTVIKVTNPDGGCGGSGGGGALGNLTPTGAADAPSVLPAASGCVDRRKFRFKLHHAKGVPVISVDIFVNGKRVVHKSGKSITFITLKKLPQKRFRVRIVAVQGSGSLLVSSRLYVGCTKSRPHTHAHHHHH